MSAKKPIFVSNLKSIMDLYAARCISEHAETTLYNDFVILKSFDSYLSQINYDGGFISEAIILEWVRELRSRLSNGRLMQYEKTINKFLRFAKVFEIKCQMPEITKATDEYQPYIYSLEELERLCAASDNISYKWNTHPWLEAEIPMLTRIFIGCGTRITEMLTTLMKDYDMENGVFTMRNTKGNIERFVPVAKSLHTIINKYCIAMGLVGKPDAYMFPGKTFNDPLNRRVYLGQFKKMLKKAGIKVVRTLHEHGPSPYCIRHTFACFAVKHLENIGLHVDNIYPYLSTYMGHQDLYGTEKYLKFSASITSEEMKRFEKSISVIFRCRVFQDDSEWI